MNAHTEGWSAESKRLSRHRYLACAMSGSTHRCDLRGSEPKAKCKTWPHGTPYPVAVVSARKISVALLGATWIALGIAAAGALSVPQYYCSEGGPTPTAFVLVIAALASGVVLLFAAIIAESVRETSLREAAVSFAVSSLTLAAGIGVMVLTQHQTSTWWQCG
jgi:hypothetical protein